MLKQFAGMPTQRTGERCVQLFTTDLRLARRTRIEYGYQMNVTQTQRMQFLACCRALCWRCRNEAARAW